MPMSAPGSERRERRQPRQRQERPARPGHRRRAPGFTLIELLIVVAIIAMTASMVAVALRNGDELRLEREAQRLSVLLETARAESRASGLPVWWRPAPPGEAPGFRFVGLPPSQALPSAWLDDGTQAEVLDAEVLSLGPEALIGPQRVELRLGDQRLVVATDGLVPFEARADGQAP
jgi:general secretion pathway protein H